MVQSQSKPHTIIVILRILYYHYTEVWIRHETWLSLAMYTTQSVVYISTWYATSYEVFTLRYFMWDIYSSVLHMKYLLFSSVCAHFYWTLYCNFSYTTVTCIYFLTYILLHCVHTCTWLCVNHFFSSSTFVVNVWCIFFLTGTLNVWAIFIHVQHV